MKIEKLNDTNFHAWKRKIQLVLALRDLDQYIDEDRPDDETRQSSWDKGDRKAQAIIGLSLSDEHLEHVADVSTAKEMWQTIMDVFQRHTLLNKLAARRNFYTATMKGGEKALTFINRVQHLASILKSMGVDVDDQEIAMAVLNGLPPRYDSLIVALDALGNEDKIFTLDFVKSRLLQEETRANMRDLEEVSKPNAALFNKSRNTRSTYHCTNCGRDGHTAQRCWGKDINGRRPDPPRGHHSSRNDGVRRSKGQDSTRVKNSAMIGQFREIGSDSDDKEEEYTCLMSKAVKYGRNARLSWIADSACTAHMTFDRAAFKKYSAVSGVFVEMGTKAKTEVAGRGDIAITLAADGQSRECLLKDVLHVPEFEYSLLSVSALDRRGVKTTFSNGNLALHKGDTIIGTGELVGSLYILDTIDSSEASHQTVHKANVASLSLWHERLGHVNFKGIVQMARKNIVKGLKYGGGDQVDTCNHCIHGKLPRLSFPQQRSTERSSELIELVHSDVCGPIEVPSLGGSRYFITFKDDCSSWLVAYPMRRKSESFSKYKNYKAMAERQTGRKLKVLRTDRGGEYLSNEFRDELEESGVRHQLSAVETPQQNGIAERINRTLLDLVRSMLHAKELPKQFWAEALATAVHIRNRVTSKSIEVDKTPHHYWHGTAPDIGAMRVFGCRCWYRIPKSKVRKLDSRANEAVMIGYADECKAYKLWDPKLERVIVSRDVVFAENEMPRIHVTQDSVSVFEILEGEDAVSLDHHSHEEDSESQPGEKGSKLLRLNAAQENDSEIVDTFVNQENSQNISHVAPESDSTTEDSQRVQSATESPKLPRRSTRTRNPPGDWWRSYISLGPWQHALLSNHVPLTFVEATNGSDAAFWQKGIASEVDSHRRNGTWKLVPREQASNILTSKWVFNVKDIPSPGGGITEKPKARLVARGFQQVQGVDYNETYAPVVKLSSIRVLLAVVAHLDLELHQMDVVTAFLHGELDEDIYMHQPEGFRDPSKPNHVCKLVKSLYGLKQAGRKWNEKMDQFLSNDLKFTSSTSDPCMYIKVDGSMLVIISLYVDDLLLAGNNLSAISWIKGELHKRFEMKDLGEAKVILGLEITRDRKNRELHLGQSKYAGDILERFGMHDSRPVSTPMIQSNTNDNCLEVIDPVTDVPTTAPYRQAIGALMYLMLGTRPDIAFAVGKLARFCENPKDKHWIAVKRVLRYVAGTRDFRLLFTGSSPLELTGFSDSDWAGDLSDRKSTSAFVFKVAGGAVSWASRKQTIVAASTCEAEYISLCATSKEALWLRRVIHDIINPVKTVKDLHPNRPTKILSDNQSAIALAANEAINRRNKHIDIAYHFVRDTIKRGEIALHHLPTTDMPADMLTKPLGRILLQKFIKSVGLTRK